MIPSKKPTILILKGLPGSGKTTYAQKLLIERPEKYKRVSKDDLRAMLDNSLWSRTNETFVVQLRDRIIEQIIEDGFDAIVDDTNLNPVHLRNIQEKFREKATTKVVDFTKVPLKTCLQRDKRRNKPVGEKVIREMHRKYLKD